MEYAASWGVAVLLGAVLMLVLSIALSWIPLLGPLFGPLIAGGIGGYLCAKVSRALLAAIVPAILLGFFIWWLDTPGGLVQIFAAVGIFPLVLAAEAALWVGAVAGALIASRHQVRGVRPA